MSTAQNSPPINVNLTTGTRETPLVNPTRPTHTPWVESSVPLLIKNTESLRYQTSFVYSDGSSGLVPATNVGFHAFFKSEILNGMKSFSWLMLSKCVRKLQMAKESIIAAYLQFS